MARSLVDKVMWVGRATVFSVGLVAILALLFAVAYVAFGTLSGNADQPPGISQQLGSGGADQVLSLDPLAVRQGPTRGFARVTLSGDHDPTRSMEVIAVEEPQDQTGVYCFDLTFRPKVAVGSPFINNAAFIATSTYPDGGVSPRDDCPAGHRDLAVKTYGSDGQPHADVIFDVVFMR
jgi:hypothetical protein